MKKTVSMWHFCRRFTHLIFQRSSKDQLFMRAGYLSYMTLLTFVPLLSVIISLLSLFPVFNVLRDNFEAFIYHHLMPNSIFKVQEYLSDFIDNAIHANTVGIFFLVIVSLVMISIIDEVLNDIFRVKKKRSQVLSFALYWMVLTLGPLLIGGSIFFGTYLTSMKILYEEQWSWLLSLAFEQLSWLFSILGYLLLYLFVPNRKVPFKFALIGALVACFFLEMSKYLFTWYFSLFSLYWFIYGALGAIPILFIWVYLLWIITLSGAEVAAGFMDIKTFHVKK